jgi:hypothetical protein
MWMGWSLSPRSVRPGNQHLDMRTDLHTKGDIAGNNPSQFACPCIINQRAEWA